MADWFGTARRRWRTTYGWLRRSGEDWAPVKSLMVALMLGLMLGVWAGRWWIPEDSVAAPQQERAQLSEGVASSPGAPSTAPTARKDATSDRLDSCEDMYAALVGPLKAVSPAMTQWEVHIGAMNKLVVGAITLAQAYEFWNQTREGAARNLAKFADARRTFDQRTARCPMPVGRASDELRDCAAGVAARHRELRRAAVALDSWRTHVRHMEMLRRGEMSPEDATRLWLESWRKGSRQVSAYRSAARGAQPVAGPHRHHHGGRDGPCAG